MNSDDGRMDQKESETRDNEGGAITANAAAVVAAVQRAIDVRGHVLGFGYFSFYDAVRSTLVPDDAGDMRYTEG